MTQGTDRRGKGTVGKASRTPASSRSRWIRSQNAVNLAYAREQEIQKRQHALAAGRQREEPDAEYTRKLSDQLKIVKQIAYQGKASQGYKVLPTQGGPPKVRRRATRRRPRQPRAWITRRRGSWRSSGSCSPGVSGILMRRRSSRPRTGRSRMFPLGQRRAPS
jgi:hypothetical protein